MIFNSTHQELKAEAGLRKNKIEFTVVPLPPQLSAGCGLAIEIGADDLPAIKAIIERCHINIKAIISNE